MRDTPGGNNHRPINNGNVSNHGKPNRRIRNSIGSFATKHSAKKSTIRNNSLIAWIETIGSSLFKIVRRTLIVIWQLLQPIIKSLAKFLKSLPWKTVVSVSAIFVLVVFSFFHFYLASPHRIKDSLAANYDSTLTLEKELIKSTTFLSQIPPYSTDISEAQTSFTEVVETTKNTSDSLPAKFLTTYAYRGDDTATEQIENLYTASNSIDLKELEKTAKYTNELLSVAKKLFESDIESNTQSYIDNLNDSLKSITDIQKSSSTLNLDTLLRIYQQLLNSAEEYQLNKDIDYFNFQSNNISSEIYKVIYQAWNSYGTDVQSNISTFRSSTESIVESI